MAPSKRSKALELADLHFDNQRWDEAYRHFLLADEEGQLDADAVERVARAAYMLGMEHVVVAQLERAHRLHLSANRSTSAARSAFWLGLTLMFQGEVGAAMGWFARADRALEGQRGCVERGYLLLPEAQKHLAEGDLDAAFLVAGQAVEIGTEFHEADLVAMARHMQGRARLVQGSVEEGLKLLDETMVAVTRGELSPRATGMIYCSVIEGCQQIYALDRSREWTAALARWCATQSSLVAFTGTCLIHRAQVLQLTGAWADAATEADRARQRLACLSPQRPVGAALYQLAEIQRLRGEFEAAEKTYGQALREGYDPQPGLARLRVMQGRIDQAVAAIERALGSTTQPLKKTSLLSAAVEIHLVAHHVDEARAHCEKLERIAAEYRTAALGALADDARGALCLEENNATDALIHLRRAADVWQAVPAPYDYARTRLGIARACHQMGDEDGCEGERQAALATLTELGAQADLRAVKARTLGGATGLTAREFEVLSYLATGKSNKRIAAHLHLSVKTIDRHLSNIFTKLGVNSRAEAVAFAYRRGLF